MFTTAEERASTTHNFLLLVQLMLMLLLGEGLHEDLLLLARGVIPCRAPRGAIAVAFDEAGCLLLPGCRCFDGGYRISQTFKRCCV